MASNRLSVGVGHGCPLQLLPFSVQTSTSLARRFGRDLFPMNGHLSTLLAADCSCFFGSRSGADEGEYMDDLREDGARPSNHGDA